MSLTAGPAFQETCASVIFGSAENIRMMRSAKSFVRGANPVVRSAIRPFSSFFLFPSYLQLA
jgi:hypothetical protein